MLVMLGIGENMVIATYLRCSTDKQDTAHQRESVKEWLKTQKLDKVQLTEYEDYAISGKTDNRPGFQALRQAIAGGKITRVVMFEMSRASRSMVDFINFVDLARKNSCSIDIVGKGIMGVESSTDMLLAAVGAFAAQQERENISARIRSGMAKSKAEGKQFGAKAGQKRRLGKTKIYDVELIKEIKSFTNAGISNYRIAKILEHKYKISETTIRRIKKSPQYK